MPANTIPFPPRPQLPVAEIAAAVEALILLLDRAVGDTDFEDNGDAELDGTDQGDVSLPERHGKQPELKQSLRPEDDEDDDAAEDDDADSAVDDGPCDEPNMDIEQEDGV